MEFELLKKSHVKRNILIGVTTIAVLTAGILTFTKAKYRVTESIPLVNGTINYKPYDFKMIAMYQENDSGEYEEIEVMPSSGYIINEEKSYCTVDGENKDTSVILKTIDGNHTFSGLQKGSKCYLYFDEYTGPIRDTLLANYLTRLTRNDFSTIVTDTTTGTIYYADTSKGRTYYFAGNPTDNWVKFGGFYWRIIRINEDGTIRLIYQGTSANTTGSNTQISISVYNNRDYGGVENAHVGYMYTINQPHGLGSNSIIKELLDQWYISNLLGVADKIDGNAGFCGDRTPYSGSGIGLDYTLYGAYNRLVTNKSPTFECDNRYDLYTTKGSITGNGALTYPIGLISADEVSYAGGVYNVNNTSSYLNTGQGYWTMSAHDYPYYNGQPTVFYMAGGQIADARVNNENGIRPVINLKADVQISQGSGTSTDPYVIVT